MFKFLSHNYNIILLTKYNYKDFDEDSRNLRKPQRIGDGVSPTVIILF